MAKKNVRNMKVCGQSGYKYETVPAITLKAVSYTHLTLPTNRLV